MAIASDGGYWSEVVALRAEGTPAHANHVEEIVTGVDRVDLAAALELAHVEAIDDLVWLRYRVGDPVPPSQ